MRRGAPVRRGRDRLATATVDIQAPEVNARPPYRSSWLDALLRGIDRVPFGPWAFYPAYATAVLLVLHVQVWLTGALAWGGFDPTQLTHGFYLVYPLALLDYLRRTAVQAWHEVRPAIDVSDGDAGRLLYELTHTPVQAGFAIAGVAALVVVLSSGTSSSGIPGLSGLALVIGLLAIWAAVALVLTLIYEISRMLRFVRRTLDRVTKVNLFQPDALYAFSGLTLRAGIGVIAIATFQLIVVPAEVNATVESVAWLAMILIAGTAAFILPLSGIHGRIVAERRSLQAAAGERIVTTINRVHASVDADDASADDHLSKRLASLIQERDLLARMPTWPWEPGTARTFASAIALPILIWLLTRLLGKVI
jgi:hypothetical protein